MAATLATIYDRTLRRLGVLGKGQTATAEDTTDMENAYTEVYARLDRLGLITWDVDDSVPDEFVFDIVAEMAYSRLDDYGVNLTRRQQIIADHVLVENRIGKLQAPARTGKTEIENY